MANAVPNDSLYLLLCARHYIGFLYVAMIRKDSGKDDHAEIISFTCNGLHKNTVILSYA